MKLLLRSLELFNAAIGRGLAMVAGGLLAAMAALVVVSVFFRYVLNASLTWSEEATRYMDAWLVFGGLAVAHRMGAHVRITLLFDMTPTRFRRYVEALSELVLLGLLVAMAYLGAQLVMANFDRNQLTPSLRIPIAWAYLAVPLGLALMALQSLERLLRLLSGREMPPSGAYLGAEQTEQDAAG
jgi:TRAP-type C4-dicarboxylate transport system permease small subunit